MKKTINQKDDYNETAKLRKTIEELKSENFRLKNIIDNIPADVYWKDKKGVWLGLNNKSSEDLREIGYFWKIEDVIGKTDYELYKKETAEVFRKNDLEVMKQGIEDTKEETNVLPSGRKIIQLSTKKPLRDEKNRIVGIIGISSDITYLKDIEKQLTIAKEAAEAASHAKSMFLANMSHDIKTPISGIVSTAEYLMHTMQDPEYKDRADDIVQSGLRLLDLMIELIEISRLEVQETTDSQIRFSLKRLIKEIVQLIKPAMSDKELRLEQVYDNQIPAYLIGNRWHLFRILLNLVSNAVKFTEKGSITINAKLAKTKDEEAIVRISVKDTGLGIPKGKEAVIFEQFSRLTPSYEGIYQGSGLGLYIVKQFVESMDGEIYVESEEGKGSTFTCVIPLKIPLLQDDIDQTEVAPDSQQISGIIKQIHSPAIPDKAISEISNDASGVSTSIRILLVEDNMIASRAAKANLESLGCTVDHASNGSDALGLFEPKKYDLIFMDLGLPDTNGIEVATKIFEIEKSVTSSKTPIVALSAHVNEDIKASCLKSGMIDVQTKPLLIDHAKLMLGKIIKIKQFNQENGKIPEITSLSIEFSGVSRAEQKGVDTVIDLELGASILGSDVQQAKEMIGTLIETLPQGKAELQKLYQEKNFSQLEKSAHKMHGGVAYTGAVKLQKALRILVDTIRQNKLDEVDKLYQNVCSEIDELIKAYKEL